MTEKCALEWDYTHLADRYDDRAPYANAALSSLLLNSLGLAQGDAVCDMGAGTGVMTGLLASLGFNVVAIEPNAAMKKYGVARTQGQDVTWREGTAEASGESSSRFRLVCFASSFNVTRRAEALAECARILAPGGCLLAFWNHRDLEDPLQRAIEAAIKKILPDFGYGSRRDAQDSVVRDSCLFEATRSFSFREVHQLDAGRFLRAWESHGTLARQAGDRFGEVLAAIGDVVGQVPGGRVSVPYETRGFYAPLRA